MQTVLPQEVYYPPAQATLMEIRFHALVYRIHLPEYTPFYVRIN
jgi:hypothetical protein